MKESEKEEYGRGHRTHIRPQKSEENLMAEQKTRRRRNIGRNTNESLPKKVGTINPKK
jgi:hypothetical protein